MNDGKWYMLVCRGCDDLLMPFESAEARGKWASAHKRGTGHDRWRVWEEPRPVAGDPEGRCGKDCIHPLGHTGAHMDETGGEW